MEYAKQTVNTKLNDKNKQGSPIPLLYPDKVLKGERGAHKISFGEGWGGVPGMGWGT